MKINIIHFFIFMLIGTLSKAQADIKWYAECSTEVVEATAFEVSFTLTNAVGKNVKFPSFEGFNVLSGPSTSKSSSWINGVSTSSMGYSFVLEAKHIGDYFIGPAIINVGGKELKTAAIKVKVSKSNLQSTTLPDGDIAAIAKMNVNKKTAFVGEQLMTKYFIYYGENLGFSEEPLKPIYPGFFVKDLVVGHSTVSPIKIGNRMFDGVLIDAVALFPQRPGMAKIDKTKFTVQKRIGSSRNPFGDYVQKTLTTNDETIEVRALPQGAPPMFSGGVGEYEIAATINANNVTTNQSIPLILIVKGTGDSRQVGPPIQQFGPDFEVFPARLLDEQESIVNNTVWHTKKYEYLIKPSKPGNFVLKPKFVYFDVNTETYKTLETATPNITVTKGNSSLKNLFDGTLSNQKKDSASFSFLLIASILAIVGAGLYFYFRKKKASKPATSYEELLMIKRSNAGKLALEKLRKAKELIDSQEYTAFYKEIGFAINNYLQGKFGITTENLNKTHIHNFLTSRPNGNAVSETYKSILEKADLSMYAGFSDKNVQDIFERAKGFIADMELE
jgi:hypothetical protein